MTPSLTIQSASHFSLTQRLIPRPQSDSWKATAIKVGLLVFTLGLVLFGTFLYELFTYTKTPTTPPTRNQLNAPSASPPTAIPTASPAAAIIPQSIVQPNNSPLSSNAIPAHKQRVFMVGSAPKNNPPSSAAPSFWTAGKKIAAAAIGIISAAAIVWIASQAYGTAAGPSQHNFEPLQSPFSLDTCPSNTSLSFPPYGTENNLQLGSAAHFFDLQAQHFSTIIPGDSRNCSQTTELLQYNSDYSHPASNHSRSIFHRRQIKLTHQCPAPLGTSLPSEAPQTKALTVFQQSILQPNCPASERPSVATRDATIYSPSIDQGRSFLQANDCAIPSQYQPSASILGQFTDNSVSPLNNQSAQSIIPTPLLQLLTPGSSSFKADLTLPKISHPPSLLGHFLRPNLLNTTPLMSPIQGGASGVTMPLYQNVTIDFPFSSDQTHSSGPIEMVGNLAFWESRASHWVNFAKETIVSMGSSALVWSRDTAAPWAGEIIAHGASSIASGASSALEQIKDTVISVAQWGEGNASSAAHWTAETITQIASSALERIKDTATSVAQWGEDNASSAAHWTAETITQTASSAVERIRDTAISAWEWIRDTAAPRAKKIIVDKVYLAWEWSSDPTIAQRKWAKAVNKTSLAWKSKDIVVTWAPWAREKIEDGVFSIWNGAAHIYHLAGSYFSSSQQVEAPSFYESMSPTWRRAVDLARQQPSQLDASVPDNGGSYLQMLERAVVQGIRGITDKHPTLKSALQWITFCPHQKE